MGVPSPPGLDLSLWRQVAPWRRLYAWPFGLAYYACAGARLHALQPLPGVPPSVGVSPVAASVALCVTLVAHVLVVLGCHWGVRFRTFCEMVRVADDAGPQDLVRATHVRVTPRERHQGRKQVVALQVRRSGKGECTAANGAIAGDAVNAWVTFEHHKVTYELCVQGEGGGAQGGGQGDLGGASYVFRKVQPGLDTLSTSELAGRAGLSADAEISELTERHGPNAFRIPRPGFYEVFGKQLLAPFFVFQVFCVALWALDDYWYYSAFTLAMLLLFEATMAANQLRNLKGLEVPDNVAPILAMRRGRWGEVPARDLLPGDLVSVCRKASAHDNVGSGVAEGEPSIPADLLLLSGSCIVNEALLTGESTPQWKAGLGKGGEEGKAVEEKSAEGRRRVLYSGTKLLMHTQEEGRGGSPRKPPDGGCPALVLRTGFGTSQGDLMRTILFGREAETANSTESALFICFLVFFALIASYNVLVQGLADPDRSRWKLFLNCVMIITSVIPPELPMELSISVNTSLIALHKLGIFCTEPFRIPFGGKVSVCCFDKTGTLTTDSLVYRGVALCGDDATRLGERAGDGEDDDSYLVSSSEQLPQPAAYCLAACHALVCLASASKSADEVVGDPLEMAALRGAGWRYSRGDICRSSAGPDVLRIRQRHHFSSSLKRMSTVVDGPGGARWVLCKGAPETLKTLMTVVPEGYDRTFKMHALQGARVLALATRRLSEEEVRAEVPASRELCEQQLEFAGFAVFSCPLKSDSARAIKALRNASHETIMITGDQSLTACHVARECRLVGPGRPILVLCPHAWADRDEDEDGFTEGDPVAAALLNDWAWVPLTDTVDLEASDMNVEEGSKEARCRRVVPGTLGRLAREGYEMCVSGDGLGLVDRLGGGAGGEFFRELARYVRVFARATPEQKEMILVALKAQGVGTLMCGDGTNDVGALRQADVGVALLSEEVARAAEISHIKRVNAIRRRMGLPLLQVPETEKQQLARSITKDGSGSATGPRAALERLAAEQAEMEAGGGDTGGRSAPPVQLGDASMASPFTSRLSSIKACLHLIRQGRCTLVTTMQMFQILGLNCLITSYVLSAMYLDGVKLGDHQATVAGVVMAGAFLFVSQSKPLESLAPQRPLPTVFNAYVVATILAQFAVHLAILRHLVKEAEALAPWNFPQSTEPVAVSVRDTTCLADNMDTEGACPAAVTTVMRVLEGPVYARPTPDDDFFPNIVNTVSFMVQTPMQATTFLVNYYGHPFMSGLWANKGLRVSILASFGVFLLAVTETVPELNEAMELVPLPSSLRLDIAVLIFLDTLVTFCMDRVLRTTIGALPPPTPAAAQAAQGRKAGPRSKPGRARSKATSSAAARSRGAKLKTT